VLTIDVSFDDLMIFDEESDSRILPVGEYQFHVGFSSRDIRSMAAVGIPRDGEVQSR
jgi:hypothetical protein